MHFLRVCHVDGEKGFRGVLPFLCFSHVEGEMSFQRRELKVKFNYF